MKTSLVGRWRIVAMEQWDQDYVDMDSPGRITFSKGGMGQLHFGCVEAELDWRFEADAERVEFTFSGDRTRLGQSGRPPVDGPDRLSPGR
jgi:hypothetical protein